MSCARKHWNIAETLQLIETYRSNPPLWDRNDKDYHKKTYKNEKLQEIAKKFQTTPHEVTRKIHNLRTHYKAIVKKHRKQLNEDKNFTLKWEYFKPLRFFYSKIENDDEMVYIGTDYDDDKNIGDAETSSTDKDEPMEQMRINPKAEEDVWVNYEIGESNDVGLTAKQKKNADINDNCKVFGDFVACELRELKQESSRRKLKRLIQRAIITVSEEDEEI